MSKENTQVLFSKRPFGAFDPKETFTIVKNPIPTLADLKDGQLLVKAYYLSLDPGIELLFAFILIDMNDIYLNLSISHARMDECY